MIIKRLCAEDFNAVIDLVWNTFLEFEAPDYEPIGVDTFRNDIVENEEFKKKCTSGENRMWGAIDGDKLIGVFVMRGESHICLAFTHRDYHRKGVATAVFNQLLNDVKRDASNVKKITLNSSPYGKQFYLHVGFKEADEEKTVNGIRFTAMEYNYRST